MTCLTTRVIRTLSTSHDVVPTLLAGPAVTVIRCTSMVVLFVDVVIIIRRFLPRYEETRLARPAVFYTCAVIGGLSAWVAVIATLSGSWTPLISNDSGSLSIGGATIAYGAWFYLVAGIAVLSLLVAGGIYFLGNATSARAVRPTQTT
jgi:glutamate:GABA antiporter